MIVKDEKRQIIFSIITDKNTGETHLQIPEKKGLLLNRENSLNLISRLSEHVIQLKSQSQ